MKLNHYFFKIFGAAILVVSLTTIARAQMPGLIQRMQVGYSFTLGWAEYESKDVIIDPVTGASYIKNNKVDVSSKFGYGGSIGTTFPIKQLGRKSMFGIGVDFLYNAYLWDYKVPYFSGFTYDSIGAVKDVSYASSYGFDGISVQMAVPVSADFKFGCDAITDKTVRFCGTIGVGGYPSMSATVDASNAGYGFGITPFVKAEFGIMAGLCFKVRAIYSLGNVPFYTEGTSLYNLNNFKSSSSLTGKQSLTLSLIIMPFAWNWNSTGWWNTY